MHIENIKLSVITPDNKDWTKEYTKEIEQYCLMLPDLMMEISKIPLKKSANGKISASATLKQLSTETQRERNLLAAIRSFDNVNSRSVFYKGKAQNNTRYCALVPITLSAWKEYKGVGYEEWDKLDPLLKVLVTGKLWNEISSYLKVNPSREEIDLLRKQALYFKDKSISATAWPNHNITFSDGNKLRAGNLFRHILLQTWMANVEFRNEYMILNTMNWDDMPEAFDEVLINSLPIKDNEVKEQQLAF